jgi:hypothetical protein
VSSQLARRPPADAPSTAIKSVFLAQAPLGIEPRGFGEDLATSTPHGSWGIPVRGSGPAHMSRDPVVVEAFHRGEDMHTRTAADLIKLAMIRIDRELAERKLRTAMLLQVHDELLFESPPEETVQVTRLVKSAMETVHKLEVPLIADVSVGDNWRDAK